MKKFLIGFAIFMLIMLAILQHIGLLIAFFVFVGIPILVIAVLYWLDNGSKSVMDDYM